MILIRNRFPGRRGEICGGDDTVVATAVIGRLVHHAEVISLKGDSCRMRGRNDDCRATPAQASGKSVVGAEAAVASRLARRVSTLAVA
ncbi:ATP-binding protein [Streptomyces sp. NPDC033538]|uniref:ATP-binding protein n=1 Tax=Streptomyces sp. NPDC033538 TaxID=3155367 RepID=UPI0033C89E16